MANSCPANVRRVVIKPLSCEYEVVKPHSLPSVSGNEITFETAKAIKEYRFYILQSNELNGTWHKNGRKYSARQLASLLSSGLLLVADRQTAERLEKELQEEDEKRAYRDREMLILKTSLIGKVFKFPWFYW